MQSVRARSRRPLTSPTKIDDGLEELVVVARKLHPTWGPKKLRSWLLHCNPQLELPAPSTVGEILRRRGLTLPHQRRRRSSQAATQPFADDPDGEQVQRIFDSSEFGLPAAIRSASGPPFASVGAGGLTKLSVWWLRLGIRLERIEPGKPQQNGRQERFHRTLKAETAKPPRATLRAQQRAFDEFRRVYNEERPHEALAQRPLFSAYVRSARRYPRPLERFDFEPWTHAAHVDKKGFIHWENGTVFISTALAHEDVKLRYDGEGEHWDVVFGPLLIGRLRETAKGATFHPTRGRMADLDRWHL